MTEYDLPFIGMANQEGLPKGNEVHCMTQEIEGIVIARGTLINQPEDE